MEALIITGLIAIIAIVIVLSGFCIVQQSETRVVERLGKYSRTLESGINILIPIIDKPRTMYVRSVFEAYDGTKVAKIRQSSRIDLREQLYDFPEQNVITKDNVTTRINALLYFQIVDPVRAVYEIDNLPNAIEKLTQTTLRNVIGELELDETLTSRDTINSKLRNVLDDATNKWGVKVNRVELQDITPPNSVRTAMESQMQAERERRAKILEAEGIKKSAILKSEGEREAQINYAQAQKQQQILLAQGEAESKMLQAEAEAQAILKIKNAVMESNSDPVSYILAVKYIETLKDITSGQDNKTIYMPYEVTSMLGSLGGIKDILNINNNAK